MKHAVIQDFIDKHGLAPSFANTALNWFIPVAEQLYCHQKRATTPFLIGLNGCQGSGKSTLTEFIHDYLTTTYQLNIAVISLDDFYLTQQQRQELAKSCHPLFKTRGVPGTHNIPLLRETLTAIKQQHAVVTLPRFNKAIDDPYPKSMWPSLKTPIDLVILEGWCWGTHAQDKSQLQQPLNELERQSDVNGIWRQQVNLTLQNDYMPLYPMMDYWLMLKAPSFDCVFQLRLQQEQKLAAQHPQGATGVMNEAQLANFIQHYQRLTEHSLQHTTEQFDVILELDQNRQIISSHGLVKSGAVL